MLLHDLGLKRALANGDIGIDPYDESMVQPSSIDLLLGNQFKIVDTSDKRDMDVRQNNSERVLSITVNEGDYFALRPEHFVLGHTKERVRFGDNMAGRVEGKSSLGRLGLMVHSTAGFVDPGFEGELTLELSNCLDVPIRLYPGMPVAQLCVFLMAGSAQLPYDKIGKYSHQSGPTSSLYHRNFASLDAGDNVRIPS